MITLNDVSAKTVIALGGYNPSAIEVLAKNIGVKSVEDVLQMIYKYPEYNWDRTLEKIKRVKGLVDNANDRGTQPEQYFIKDYSDPILDRQNKLNIGNYLPLDNPTHYQTTLNRLRGKTIAEIKEDLAHITPDGRCYISGSNSTYRNIGSAELPRIVTAIEMFQDQIERQAQLTDDRTKNLFDLDRDKKIEIVEQSYTDIIDYLVCNTQARLIWGQLSDTQKKKYISSTINNNKPDRETRANIISYVSDYTTLPELEKVANHDLKVLKRFIVK